MLDRTSDDRDVKPGANLKPGLRTNNAEHASADVEPDEPPIVKVVIVTPKKK